MTEPDSGAHGGEGLVQRTAGGGSMGAGWDPKGAHGGEGLVQRTAGEGSVGARDTGPEGCPQHAHFFKDRRQGVAQLMQPTTA